MWVEPINNRMVGKIVKAYLKLLKLLNRAKTHPKLFVLDNETIWEYNVANESKKIKYKKVPLE